MSDHKNIDAAFLAAQPNFKKPQKNAENTHFKNKYADLDAVLDAVRPALNEQGITISQPVVTTELGNFVRTLLVHSATQTKLETDVPLLMGKQDMQAFKSASTYARRIGVENLTGIAPSDDDDDAEGERVGNDMGAALKDAWKQGVMDNLPANATPQQTAEAFAQAIIEDFHGKGERALRNRWNKHKALIAQMEQRFPALHEKIVDAYENDMMAVTGNDVAAE